MMSVGNNSKTTDGKGVGDQKLLKFKKFIKMKLRRIFSEMYR